MSDEIWRRAMRRNAALGVGRRFMAGRTRAHEVLQRFSHCLGDRILDVGAGSNGAIFKDALGSRYQALDVATSYKVTLEEQKAAIGHTADLERVPIPFADQSFDTVLCLDVLEHVDNIHSLYDELFRLSRGTVVISLPNNWPNFHWNIVAGRNIGHSHGYGLGPQPKAYGQRHKYFFNTEEACRFLIGRMPAGFECVHIEFRFERGTDGLLAGFPPTRQLFHVGGKATLADARKRVGPLAPLALAVVKGLYFPVRLVDIALTAALFGWGDKVRFYNLFCRQIWTVFRRVK